MKYGILFCLIFWGLVLTVARAWGEPIKSPPVIGRPPPLPLTVYSIDNSYMRPQTRERLIRRVVEYYRGYGVRMNRRLTKRISDPYLVQRVTDDLNIIMQEYSYWFLKFRNANGFIPNTAIHILAPPFEVNGSRYIGGVAHQGSIKSGAFSYSNCHEFNSKGEPRFRESVVAMIHELGHSVFDCDHEPGAVMMNANAAYEQNQAGKLVPNLLIPLGPKCIEKVKNFNKGFR